MGTGLAPALAPTVSETPTVSSTQSVNLLAQIAPQRSTQYSALASTLAPIELSLSPIGKSLNSIESRSLGGQIYLECSLTADVDEQLQSALGTLAMTSAYFHIHPELGGLAGPFLRPIETSFVPSQPPELATTRRYRGKTNELFTHWLCNIAKFSSAFVDDSWESLSLLDPLAGGGTSIFTALMLGANTVAGIEQDAKDGKSTISYLRQFANDYRIPIRVKEERLKKLGRRWTASMGQTPILFDQRLKRLGSHNAKPGAKSTDANTDAGRVIPRRNAADFQSLIWVQGDTSAAQLLLPTFRPHLIVTDLPYGIQHQGQLRLLLENALPRWLTILRRGGTAAMAWDATRFSRHDMHRLLSEILAEFPAVTILTGPPFDSFAHQVDRVIKTRDVIVCRKM